MAKTYMQVMAEIGRLQKEAERLRQKELQGVIGKIREAIDEYGLTSEDLGLAPGRRSDAPAKRPAHKAAGAKRRGGVVRYRDDAGNSWSGFGRRPQWYVAAVESGRPPTDLLAR